MSLADFTPEQMRAHAEKSRAAGEWLQFVKDLERDARMGEADEADARRRAERAAGAAAQVVGNSTCAACLGPCTRLGDVCRKCRGWFS